MAQIHPINGETIQIAKADNIGMWQDYEFGRPDKYSVLNEDFLKYVANDWTVTETDAGATQALATTAPANGGVLLITNTNLDNDAVYMQHVGNSFAPESGKRLYFECRFQASEATSIDLAAGLVITDTSPLAHTDGVLFVKADDAATMAFSTTSGSVTSTETGIATFAASTYMKVGFKMTGTNLVEYYVNDVKQGEFNTNIPTALMRPTLAIVDGDTAAALGALTMSVDYIIVAKER